MGKRALWSPQKSGVLARPPFVSVTIVIVRGLPCRSFTELSTAAVTLPLRLEEGICGLETKPTKICPQPVSNSHTNRVKNAGALRGTACLPSPFIQCTYKHCYAVMHQGRPSIMPVRLPIIMLPAGSQRKQSIKHFSECRSRTLYCSFVLGRNNGSYCCSPHWPGFN